MGKITGISWADHTFNPWHGCVEAGPECDACYAREFSRRIGYDLWGKDKPRRFFEAKHWHEPMLWNAAAERAGQRRRVFCGSMCDVLEDRRDLDEHRARLWALIERTPWLDWLLLTKRPAGFGSGVTITHEVVRDGVLVGEIQSRHRSLVPASWHAGRWPRNAWAGTTCGTQAGLARVRMLLECAGPAPVRWVSGEPLLEMVDWSSVLWPVCWHWDGAYPTPEAALAAGAHAEQRPQALVSADRHFANWLIIGGESGARPREMSVEWVASAQRQCRAAGVPLWVKQDSGRRPGQQGRILDELFVHEAPEPRP